MMDKSSKCTNKQHKPTTVYPDTLCVHIFMIKCTPTLVKVSGLILRSHFETLSYKTPSVGQL